MQKRPPPQGEAYAQRGDGPHLQFYHWESLFVRPIADLVSRYLARDGLHFRGAACDAAVYTGSPSVSSRMPHRRVARPPRGLSIRGACERHRIQYGIWQTYRHIEPFPYYPFSFHDTVQVQSHIRYLAHAQLILPDKGTSERHNICHLWDFWGKCCGFFFESRQEKTSRVPECEGTGNTPV